MKKLLTKVLCITLALCIFGAGAEGFLFSIPEGISVIETEAFGDIGADEVYIPSGVSVIGPNAFSPSVHTIYGISGTAAEEYALANGLTFIPMDISDISISVPPFVSPCRSFSVQVDYTCVSPCEVRVELMKDGAVFAAAESADGHSVLLRTDEDGLYDYRVTVMGNAVVAERFFEGETEVYEPVRLISDHLSVAPGESFCPVDETETREIAGIFCDGDGLTVKGTSVTALKTGIYTLTVTALEDGDTVYTDMRVTVADRVQTILPGEDEIRLNLGDSFLLMPELLPEGSGDGVIRFESSDPDVASVDETGLVSAVSQGEAAITISAFGAEAHVSVRVLIPSSSLNIIAPFDVSRMLSGTKNRLYYEIGPAEADNVYVYWTSSDPAVARVDAATGLVEALSAGTAVITAKAEDGSGACDSLRVNVLQGIEELTLSVPSKLQTGEFASASVSYAPSGAFGTDFILESSDPAVVSVSSDGFMKANAAGTCVISVYAEGGRTASAAVRVYEKAQSLSCFLPYLNMTKGTVRTLSDIITCTPASADTESIRFISSDESIVFAESGVLRAVKEGSAFITATYDDLSVTLPVTVTAAKAPSLAVMPVYKVLTAGESCILTASQNVLWYTDDPDAVLLTPSGKSVNVTALKTANVNVCAIDAYGSVVKTEIQINPVFITALEFVENTLSLMPGEEAELSVRTAPAGASGDTLLWYSSDERVCEVRNGTVLATGAGSCVITAITNSGVSAECTVNVSEIPMTDAFLDETAVTLRAGEEYDIAYGYSPAGATPARFDWTADSDICSVEGSTVKALSAGTCVLTGTAVDGSGLTLILTVYVEEIPLRALILSRDEYTMNAGETYLIDYSVYPMDASFGEAVFTSSDERIACVDGSGLVTALAPGDCTIFVTAGAGETVRTEELELHVASGASSVYRALIMGQFTVKSASNYLPFSTHGTTSVRAALSRSSGSIAYDEIDCLSASPSRETVQSVLMHFASVADEDDVTVIYMLGHGHTNTTDRYYMSMTNGNVIKGNALIDAATQIPGHVILVICSCNSGEIFGCSSLQAVMSRGGAYTAPRGNGHLSVITSTTDGSSSFYNVDDESLSYDFFSRAFTQGLGWNMVAGGPMSMLADTNGDGSVSVSEIASYVPYRTQYLLSSFRQLYGDKQFWGNVNQYPKYFIASGDSDIQIVSAVR